MKERTIGILRKRERELIDAYASPPDHELAYAEKKPKKASSKKERLQKWRDTYDTKESHVKSLIRKGPADTEGIQEALNTIYHDLQRIENFHRSVEEQPGGTHNWTTTVLPGVQLQLEALKLFIERLEATANTSPITDEDEEEVREAVVPHLAKGLNELERFHEAPGERRDSERFREDKERFRERGEDLKRLLKSDGRTELFQWIGENPGQRLPREHIGNNPWSWHAAVVLKDELFLVEGEKGIYRLTEKGEAIQKALTALMETDAVSSREEDAGLAALRLLERHL